jgi:tetratricopeptide (TPR) repeat protein
MIALKEISKKECEDKFAKNPESFIFSRLADCYRKQGDIQHAIDVCSQGLASHPDSITGRIILGRCYLEQEKYKEAAVEFTKVIEHDRRNQVAIKMLADVYAHQGMSEKAGDLYSFLLTIDPENQSIVNLAAGFTGSGAANIYHIIGISAAVPESRATGGSAGGQYGEKSSAASVQPVPAVDPFRDTATQAFAQTIQMDAEELQVEASRQPSSPFVESGISGGAEELASPTATPDSSVEEIVADIFSNSEAAVTGDDITARMSMMFKEEAVMPEIAQEAVGQPAGLDSGILSEAAPGMPENRSEETPPSEPLPEEISGSDISSRIEQLFGEAGREEMGLPEQPSTVDYTSIFDASTSDSVQSPLQGSIAESDAAHEDVIKSQEESEEGREVSGEDIVMRMSEIFEKTDDAASAVQSSEETLSTENADSLILGMSETPDSSGFAPPAPESETPETLVQQEAVSGDDIAERLETIFEEEVSAPSMISSLPVDEGPALPQTNEAEPLIPDAIALENSLELQEEVPAVEATVVQDAENDPLLPLVEQTQVIPLADTGIQFVSDAVGSSLNAPSEELGQENINEPSADSPDGEPALSAPEMSGDDIRARLDEIFPESLTSEETLTMVDEIPDGDKIDEKPNEGFYTMSGNNAVTKTSDETLFLKQLDEAEIELPLGSKGGGDALLAELPDSDRIETGPIGSQEENSHDDLSLSSEQSGADPLSAIPDHVLTPTLADIYFQQGQPHLAVQIYSRLLEKDPDNEKIANRLRIIKSLIDENAQKPPSQQLRPEDDNQRETQRMDKKNPTTKKAERKKASAVSKPLAGVHIKKKRK